MNERTYRSSPTLTTQIVTGLRSVPSVRCAAIRSSSAAPIASSSSVVHAPIAFLPGRYDFSPTVSPVSPPVSPFSPKTSLATAIADIALGHPA